MSCLAGEVDKPHKTFPRALLWGVLLVVASYLLPTMAALGVSPEAGEWELGFYGRVAQQVRVCGRFYVQGGREEVAGALFWALHVDLCAGGEGGALRLAGAGAAAAARRPAEQVRIRAQSAAALKRL